MVLRSWKIHIKIYCCANSINIYIQPVAAVQSQETIRSPWLPDNTTTHTFIRSVLSGSADAGQRISSCPKCLPSMSAHRRVITNVGADVIVAWRFKQQIEIPAADREQTLPQHVQLHFIEQYLDFPSPWSRLHVNIFHHMYWQISFTQLFFICRNGVHHCKRN